MEAVYHHESVVNFSTVHTTLTKYNGERLVFDSIRVGDREAVVTPKSHRKKLMELMEVE